ncbi:PREDICTED: uncharacterized protein LOC108370007 [Rhagoletis zephyria]|uniref:uncharacterized protein LOC108370007 n=1 Tax=Rhagoletis zephyria TaxID=28612 RepID=UPI00081162A4|nr:PREDICTED: uncharacterized protein LOC108370007 [Rhagoletis zephyria]
MGAGNSTPQTAHILNPARAMHAIQVTPSVINRLEKTNQQISETTIPSSSKDEQMHCARCCTCGFFKGKDKEASLLAMKSNELQESQYAKTLEKLEAMLGKPVRFADVNGENLKHLEQQLLKCYADNPREPLICSQAAKEYQNFVFQQQFKAILNAKNISTQK